MTTDRPVEPRSPDRGIALPIASRLVCHGCGYVVPMDEPRPFRCPNGKLSDNVDHVLRRTFYPEIFGSMHDARTIFLDHEPNPFRRYRSLLYSYEVARGGGMTDSSYLRIVDRLDAAVEAIDGAGFVETPFAQSRDLAAAIGLEPRALWIKDETGNVSGSHKARHLMGVMIWIEISRRLGLGAKSAPRLAIASCGNAALAAGVIACAAGRPLEAFVPTKANRRILERLVALDVELTACARRPDDPPGDPCFQRFVEAWADGALPFSCQAKRNGLTIEGGCTLVWEVLSALIQRGIGLDHLVVQVGGGALATACVEGLRNAATLGLIEKLPSIHTVQTRSVFPIRRAYEAISARLLAGESPKSDAFDVAADADRARRIRDEVSARDRARVLEHARRHRGEYMWPWEAPLESIASGILDDETYDWAAVCEGMLETGGVPLVVDEETLAEAHRLGREHTAIAAEPTGTAGLAGLLDLQRAGVIGSGETVALLFTGVER